MRRSGTRIQREASAAASSLEYCSPDAGRTAWVKTIAPGARRILVGCFFALRISPVFRKSSIHRGGLQPLVQSFHEGRPREGTAEKDPRKAGRQRNAFIAARLPFQAEAVPTSSGGDIDPVVLFQQRGESGDLMIEEEAVFLIRELQPDIFEENGAVEDVPQGSLRGRSARTHQRRIFARQAQGAGKAADPAPITAILPCFGGRL